LIRIGHIDFINMLPLDLYSSNGLSYTKILGPPTLINRMLLNGEVDVGVISVAYYLKHKEDLLRLGHFGILSDGPVLSVLLFSKRDLSNPHEKGFLKVYETSKSATSVLLYRLILREVYRVEPLPVPTRSEAEAVLLIGNEALLERQKGGWDYCYDLGAEWKKFTGLPMVFAVLATSVKVFDAKKEELKSYLEILDQNYRKSINECDTLVAKAKELAPLEEELLYRYFQCLQYEIGEREEKAIALFEKLIV
jgi:chorismate dehydratase